MVKSYRQGNNCVIMNKTKSFYSSLWGNLTNLLNSVLYPRGKLFDSICKETSHFISELTYILHG